MLESGARKISTAAAKLTAERLRMTRTIAGHELATHGQDHRRVTTQTPREFREDVRRSKRTIEDVSGEEVIGYRAPSYSITARSFE